MVTKKPKIPNRITLRLDQERLAELMTRGRISLLLPLQKPIVLEIVVEAQR